MKRFHVKGHIVPNSSKWLYDLVGIEAVSDGDIVSFLEEANGEEVELFINSPGGVVNVGSDIYSELRAYKGKSTAYITGVSASTSSFMMLGADKVISFPTARIMIHNSKTRAEGDYRDMEKAAIRLRKANIAFSNAYQLKTGKSLAELQTLMDEETWFTAKEALNYGFIDEIALNEGEDLEDVRIAASLSGSSIFGANLDVNKLNEIAAIYKATKERDDGAESSEEDKNESGEETRPVSDKQINKFKELRRKLEGH